MTRSRPWSETVTPACLSEDRDRKAHLRHQERKLVEDCHARVPVSALHHRLSSNLLTRDMLNGVLFCSRRRHEKEGKNSTSTRSSSSRRVHGSREAHGIALGSGRRENLCKLTIMMGCYGRRYSSDFGFDKNGSEPSCYCSYLRARLCDDNEATLICMASEERVHGARFCHLH